jgi:hypothetical protein
LIVFSPQIFRIISPHSLSLCLALSHTHTYSLSHTHTTKKNKVIGRNHAKGQVYNIQHPQAVTFDGVCRLAAEAATGKKDVEIVHFDPKKYDFGKKKVCICVCVWVLV